MADTQITKRLHISGLTPSITPADISQRLSSFGTVKALDGFGLVNGLGEPRRFGYATMESTASKLAKCMSALSGSTWKGAKLRIGEARPDYKQRLSRERQDEASEPPKKKRRRVYGVEAADMSLVTPENAASRKGWKVTPLGRAMRPIRMRPDRPLPLPNLREHGSKLDGVRVKKRGKRRVGVPVTRARRRTIDPMRWGSVCLKGMFLEVDGSLDRPGKGGGEVKMASRRGLSESGYGDDVPITAEVRTQPNPTTATIPDDNTDIILEQKRSIALVQSMFGGGEWTGRESVESMDEGREPDVLMDDAPVVDVEMVAATDKVPQKENSQQPSARTEVQTKLKDLFAVGDDTANFSLLEHLNLDLELDESPIAVPTFHGRKKESASFRRGTPGNAPSTGLDFDPKQPLFFAPLSNAGGDWRDPGIAFWRTETEEDMRKRWAEEKVELTREWKRRWREAGKMRNRYCLK